MKNVFRSSSFIDKIETSLRKGEATVYLKDGNIYTYSNVSRRAILVNQSFESSWLNDTQLNEYLEPSDGELREIELEELDELNEEYATANAW